MAPRRKRTRRRRRHHYNNQPAKNACHPDEVLRNYSEDLRTPELSRELLLDPATTPLRTPGPRSVRGNSFLFITDEQDAIERSPDASSDCASPRTLKEVHRLRPAGLFGLNTSVPSSNVSRASQSCTDLLDDVAATSCSFRLRARSSAPKVHSPGVEKTIPTSNVETQTILDTPKRPQDYFLDLEDYDRALFATPQSPYRTPTKRTGLDASAESYNRIEDLNKIGCRDNEDDDREPVNRSKNIEPENLRHLQALNNQLLKQVMETERAIRGREEGRKEEASTSELSFFTPHLYNSKFASTPIKNAERRSLEPTVPIHQQADSLRNSSVSVLMESNVEGARHSPPSVRRSASVSTRRSSSLSSPKRLSLSFRKSFCAPAPGRLSLLESHSHEVTATEVLVTVLAWIRKLHGRYIGRIAAKISQGCSWLGNSLRRGIAAFIKEYSETPKPSCSSCESLKSGLDVIKVEMDGRMGEMKSAMAKMQAEIAKLREDMADGRRGAGVVPPAPPPPPPPLPLPSDRALVINKKGGSAIEKKKKAESSRPVISLKEILNVKLRKTSDRSLPERRHTACAEILQQVKLRPTSSSFYDSKRDRL